MLHHILLPSLQIHSSIGPSPLYLATWHACNAHFVADVCFKDLCNRFTLPYRYFKCTFSWMWFEFVFVCILPSAPCWIYWAVRFYWYWEIFRTEQPHLMLASYILEFSESHYAIYMLYICTAKRQSNLYTSFPKSIWTESSWRRRWRKVAGYVYCRRKVWPVAKTCQNLKLLKTKRHAFILTGF